MSVLQARSAFAPEAAGRRLSRPVVLATPQARCSKARHTSWRVCSSGGEQAHNGSGSGGDSGTAASRLPPQAFDRRGMLALAAAAAAPLPQAAAAAAAAAAGPPAGPPAPLPIPPLSGARRWGAHRAGGVRRVCACPTQLGDASFAAQPPAETYVNAEGFAFDYPAGWVVAFDRTGSSGNGAVIGAQPAGSWKLWVCVVPGGTCSPAARPRAARHQGRWSPCLFPARRQQQQLLRRLPLALPCAPCAPPGSGRRLSPADHSVGFPDYNHPRAGGAAGADGGGGLRHLRGAAGGWWVVVVGGGGGARATYMYVCSW